MSVRVNPRRLGNQLQASAAIFSALGDSTRLRLLITLCGGDACSIAKLTGTTQLTRQAVTRHLRVLEYAGLVESERAGRSSLFRFNPVAIEGVRDYLELVSGQWEQTLLRLKNYVENRR